MHHDNNVMLDITCVLQKGYYISDFCQNSFFQPLTLEYGVVVLQCIRSAKYSLSSNERYSLILVWRSIRFLS